jgi:hypothetical protein
MNSNAVVGTKRGRPASLRVPEPIPDPPAKAIRTRQEEIKSSFHKD